MPKFVNANDALLAGPVAVTTCSVLPLPKSTPAKNWVAVDDWEIAGTTENSDPTGPVMVPVKGLPVSISDLVKTEKVAPTKVPLALQLVNRLAPSATMLSLTPSLPWSGHVPPPPVQGTW